MDLRVPSQEVINEDDEDEEEEGEQDPKNGLTGFFSSGKFILGFSVKHRVDFGQAVYVVGSTSWLGNWCPQKAIRLCWSSDHLWYMNITAFGTKKTLTFKYKYFVSDFEMKADSLITWEPGINRNFNDELEYKFLVHIEDVWGYIKIVFRLALDESIHSVYVAGDLDRIGYSEEFPGRMYLRVLRDERNDHVSHFWEKEALIPSEFDRIEYRYGIKERKNSNIRWERNSNRVFNFKDVKCYVDEDFDAVRDSIGVNTNINSFTYKNRSHIRLDHNFADDFLYTEISDNLWIGPYPKLDEIERLKDKGCDCLLNLKCMNEMEPLALSHEFYEDACGKFNIRYTFSEVINQDHFEVQEIFDAATKLKECLTKQKCVYLFCKNGLKRAMTVAVIYYYHYLNHPLKLCIEQIAAKRWRANLTEEDINRIIGEIHGLLLK